MAVIAAGSLFGRLYKITPLTELPNARYPRYPTVEAISTARQMMQIRVIMKKF